MQFEKPKLPQRIYVTARDAETGGTANFTVYGTTPEQFKEQVQRGAGSQVEAGAGKHGTKRTPKQQVA